MSASAVYQGWVAHRRIGPVPHSFRYRVFMPLLDLDELPELLDRIPLWSARRPAPARFRGEDYLGGGGQPLADRARDLALAHLGRRPSGPIRLLANPRYLGVGFNPVSFYFLHAGDGNGNRLRDRGGDQHAVGRAHLVCARRSLPRVQRSGHRQLREADACLALPADGPALRDLARRPSREPAGGDPKSRKRPRGVRRHDGAAPLRAHPCANGPPALRISANDAGDADSDLLERSATDGARSLIPSPPKRRP